MMRQFPGFLIRTAIFGWLLVFPSLDKKRNIKNIHQFMPLWYSILLKVYMFGVFVTLLVVVLLLPILILL